MSHRATRSAIPGLALIALATPSSAQQFQEQSGAIPGTRHWTEGVECADVDNDGDLDLFFADGDGFASAGPVRTTKLIINKLEVAAGTYADESVARLGTLEGNSKGVATGDVDADGWVDALVANAFNNRFPILYTNQGAPNPGFFTASAAASGFVEQLNSASAGFGDVDNDGDLDVIVLDSGNSYLSGSGGRPRLFFNDGAGFFTEDAAAMNAPVKSAHMDVQFVDIDNDWDLDFFGPCRASNSGGNHYLMLNDGDGNFTDASSLIPATSSSVYEAEVGDLDGDDDLDMFFVSSSGFAEGHVRNNWVGSGALTFTKGSTFSNGDDNEVCLIDYDNDGDLDSFVGSLASTEKMFRNNGNLTWTAVGAIQSISDSTLDCTAADLDNDGDYDLITAQGESVSSQWDNKIYVNTGGADTLPPVIAREEPLAGLPDADGPWIVRAQVRDQVMDDGKTWVRAEAEYTVLTTAQTLSVELGLDEFTGAVVQAGTAITWTNPVGGPARSVSSALPGQRFHSGTLAPGERFTRTLVTPGTYVVSESVEGGGAAASTFEVVGATTIVAATDSGGGIFRFEMTDTDAGAGVQLSYLLRFTDWAGNVSTSTPVTETLIACGWSQYGLASSPPNTIDLDGAGSADPGQAFSAVATNVTGVVAVYGVALGTANYPLLGGIGLIDPLSIVKYKVRPVNAGSASWNLVLPVSGSGVGGVSVYFQCSALISTAPDVWEHSNGLQLTLCP